MAKSEMEKKNYHYETKVVRLPNGKRKYVRGKTKAELEEKLNAINRELGLGIDIGNETTVKAYTEVWLKTTRCTDVTEQTERRIRGALRNHVYPLIGEMKLRDVKPTHIRAIMSAVSRHGRGTQSLVLSLLSEIFALAVDDDIIVRTPVSPTIKAKGKASDETPPLTPEQEKELLAAAEGRRVYAAAFIILHTGLRRGELTGLMWSDIDYDKHVIHVRRHVISGEHGEPVIVNGAKTEAGVRDVPMPDVLISYLRDLQKTAKSVYVFTNNKNQLCSPSALSQQWGTLNKSLSFHSHPHQLRHTYATKLFEQGLDIKQIQYVMGHSDPSVTLKIYTHYREESRKAETVEKVRAAFG